MSSFSASDLSNMQSAQEAHMMDTCKRQAVSVTADSMNQQVESWPADGAEIVCGLDMRSGSEKHGKERTIVQYDATLRLPLGTTVNEEDQIKITKRFGTALATPLVYRIVSPIQQGPSGIRLLLRRVEV